MVSTAPQATPTDASGGPTMRDHWWWRPGWRVGRAFYTWHLTFDHAPDVHRLARDYLPLVDRPGLDPIPERWLHLTMQGLGFTEEAAPTDVDAIVAATRRRLATLEPFTLTLGPATVDPEVVRLRVSPVEPVARVRDTIREAMGDVWGPDHVPEPAHGFTPHVSLAYSSADGPMQPILDALASSAPRPATAHIAEAQLIVLNRDHRQYQWTIHASVPLGARP